MTEEQPEGQAFHALAVVMRDYLSYGESGMEDLKDAVQVRRPKPVVNAFCKELRHVLDGEAPVPTDVINAEFRRRAGEHASDGEEPDDVLVYDAQQAYEALADLWEYLELDGDGEPTTGPVGALRTAARRQRSQMFWVEGDPVAALKAWMSWPSLALFVGGAVVSIVCWTFHDSVTLGFLRGLLLVLTLAGFVAAAVGGGTLWLRRVRYVNPDAFLPSDQIKDKRRRR